MVPTFRRPVLAVVTSAVALAMAVVVAAPASAATTEPAILPGGPNYTNGFINIDDVLYFTAHTDTDSYLGTYDGTSFTTYDGPGAPAEVRPYVALGDDILMEGDCCSVQGLLWTFDRVTETFTEWGNTTDGPMFPRDFVVLGDTSYFRASNGVDYVLWKFDGTTVTELASPPFELSVYISRGVAAFDGKIYMSADTGLTVYDPDTNTFTTDPTIPNADYFTEFQGKLFWVASPLGVQTLYSFDPSTSTTTIFNGPGDPADPAYLAAVGDRLYLSASDGTDDRVASFDGTTFTTYEAAGEPVDPYGFIGFDGKVYFTAYASGVPLLHWFDPSAGTFQHFSTPVDPYGYAVLGDRLIFAQDEAQPIWFIQTIALASTGLVVAPAAFTALGLLGAGGLVIVALAVRRRTGIRRAAL